MSYQQLRRLDGTEIDLCDDVSMSCFEYSYAMGDLLQQ
jgi:hypothetical protein